MHNLTKLALVGTANSPLQANTLPAIDNALPAASREAQLLWQAGAHALYLQAGRLAQEGQHPPPAPADNLPTVSSGLFGMLTELLAGQWEELETWATQRLQQAGLRLPPSLLLRTLDITNPNRRTLWQPLFGQRGLWLAAQNPEWHWAIANTTQPADDSVLTSIWQEGTLTARRRALAEQRRRNPALARDWLEAVLPQEKADARLTLVDVLAQGTTADDIPLLERLMSDRSTGVRQFAVGLLCRQPTAALAQRWAERAQACLQWSDNLIIDPPQELPKDWERDGLLANPPAGEGKRAFWLRQLVALVPPSLWKSHTKQSPAYLIAALPAQEWGEAVLRGLADATARFADAEWADALLQADASLGRLLATDALNPLWHALPMTQRTAHCLARLQVGEVPLAALRAVPAPWPAAISQAVLAKLAISQYSLANPDDFTNPLTMLLLAILHGDDTTLPQLNDCAQQWLANLSQREGWAFWQPKRDVERYIALSQAKQHLIKETPL
ncbi:DUF5691 domain-containing protein [Chitinivorax sp. B]|uniref:DUF5691 domain-containing protein n=1 Tax=Chitinivorax sp. B TaxID=2502235 RepID=UPI0010F820A0|nr:DUF5691 domain-containing protein [Chitinivorax sp. B]